MVDTFSTSKDAQAMGNDPSSRHAELRSPLKSFKPNFLVAWVITIAAAVLSTMMAYRYAPATADPNPSFGFFHLYLLSMVAHFWWLTCITKFKQVQDLDAEQKVAYQWLLTSYLAVMTAQFAVNDPGSSPRESAVRSALMVFASGVGWCFMIWSILRSEAAAKVVNQRKSPFDD